MKLRRLNKRKKDQVLECLFSNHKGDSLIPGISTCQNVSVRDAQVDFSTLLLS